MEAKVTTEAVTASRKDMSLQELIEKLHILFADERVNVDEVNDVLSAYQAKRSDWEQYAIFDTNRSVLEFLSFIFYSVTPVFSLFLVRLV